MRPLPGLQTAFSGSSCKSSITALPLPRSSIMSATRGTARPSCINEFGGLMQRHPCLRMDECRDVFSLGLPGLNGFIGEFLIFKVLSPSRHRSRRLLFSAFSSPPLFAMRMMQSPFQRPLAEIAAHFPSAAQREGGDRSCKPPYVLPSGSLLIRLQHFQHNRHSNGAPVCLTKVGMSKEIIPINRIAQSIYLLRGQKVMLDFDLANLYGVKTKILNQAVKRNRDRFPGDFMFQLNANEVAYLRANSDAQRKLQKAANCVELVTFVTSSAKASGQSRLTLFTEGRRDAPTFAQRARSN